ncbi:MAG: hypothetical protein ABIG66_02985 [Candidatus Kerfeldbacteria bacterium]
MATRQRTIAGTRNQTNSDEAHKDRTKKAEGDSAVELSTVEFGNFKALSDSWELINMVERLIRKHGNEGEEVTEEVDEDEDTLIYSMKEKNLAKSIATHAESAFKGYNPKVEFKNPGDNEYYRIVVTFN